MNRCHDSVKPYTCDQCDFKTPEAVLIEKHIRIVHEKVAQFTKNKIQWCAFYNNTTCTNGDCKFSHTDAPVCKYDGNCVRKLCMFQHHKQDFQKWSPIRPAERNVSRNQLKESPQVRYKGPVWEYQGYGQAARGFQGEGRNMVRI